MNLRPLVYIYIYIYFFNMSSTEELPRQLKLFTTSNPNKEDRLTDIVEQTFTIYVMAHRLIVWHRLPSYLFCSLSSCVECANKLWGKEISYTRSDINLITLWRNKWIKHRVYLFVAVPRMAVLSSRKLAFAETFCDSYNAQDDYKRGA